MASAPPLDRPVTAFLSTAAFTLRDHLTIDQALAELRSSRRATDLQSQVIYFYVVNSSDQLVGILPARQLLLSPGDTLIRHVMSRDMIVLSDRETLFDALELFAMHRLLAIPVIDKDKHFLGIVELALYTDEVFDLAQNRQLNEVFQLMGLHLEQHKQGSVWRGFRLRMPWLLSNITGGLICAALGSFFEATVQRVVLVALFIPLILTLAESISVQSMTLAIEQAAVGGTSGRKRTFSGQFSREAAVSILLGICSGLIVGCISLFWNGPRFSSVTIGSSIAAAMFLAAMLGQAVPKFIHSLKLNPRIASGPVTLAIVDIVTITVYLSAASLVLRGDG